MRSVDLIKIAAEAEVVRLRALAARQSRRVVYGVIALIFVLAVLALAEAAVWQVLSLYVAPLYATLILLGTNLIVAIIFGILAMQSSPSHTEEEALRVRQDALKTARGSLLFTSAGPVATTLLRLRNSAKR